MKRKTYFDHDIIELLAFVGLVLAGFLYLLQFVLSFFDATAGKIDDIAGLIRDIAFAASIGLAGYKFTLGKKLWIKIIFWIALIAFLCFAVFHVIPQKV